MSFYVESRVLVMCEGFLTAECVSQRMKLRNDLLATRQRVVSIPDTRRIKVRAGDVVLLACDGEQSGGAFWSCLDMNV